MLDPCSPCVCPNKTCHQCPFGYNSKEANHTQLAGLLCSYIKGDANPSQQRIAKSFIDKHPDFKEELEAIREVEKAKENKFTGLAKDVRELYMAFKNEYFTDDEAIELTKTYLGVAFQDQVYQNYAKRQKTPRRESIERLSRYKEDHKEEENS